MSAPLAPTAQLLARLDGPALDALVDLVIDHVLERPVSALVDPAWLAAQIVAALRAGTRDDRTEAWVRGQLRAVQQRVPPGRLGQHLPAEVAQPLRAVLGRKVIFDRALVGRLLDHEAARHLVTDLLSGALHGFVDKLRPVAGVASGVGGALGGALGAGRASKGFDRLKLLGQGVKGLSEGVIGGISQELEQRAEGKVKDFVDGALHAAMEQVADHLCAPENAARYAAYRLHVLDTVLDSDNRVLVGEIDKLDPDHLVRTAAGVLRSLARRPGFEAELQRAVQAALDEAGPRSLGDLLRETGLERGEDDGEWRRRLRAPLAAEARVFIRGPAFAAWLDALLA
ncbi:MAG: hypothetical protein JNM72_15995 [Deltaproteobacteria bacterium]|nr:hypothetical protein [Deltaproteobacteria bacterium]